VKGRVGGITVDLGFAFVIAESFSLQHISGFMPFGGNVINQAGYKRKEPDKT